MRGQIVSSSGVLKNRQSSLDPRASNLSLFRAPQSLMLLVYHGYLTRVARQLEFCYNKIAKPARRSPRLAEALGEAQVGAGGEPENKSARIIFCLW